MHSPAQLINAMPTPAQTGETWFDYPIRVHPHHTDYAGVVWHGSYLTWMEEARVECLRQIGTEYADLVAIGCELPVIEISIRYHRALRFGAAAIIKTRLSGMEGVRMKWDYRIESTDGKELYVTAQVKLVAIDSQKGKIMRQLPAAIQTILSKFST